MPAIGWVRVLAVALRVLVVFVSFELSGISDVAERSFRGAETSNDCCAECPFEEHGNECPPGCPNCHCSHGGIALPAPFETVSGLITAQDGAIVRRPDEAGVPHAPQLPGVYRPPRLGPAVSWSGQRSA